MTDDDEKSGGKPIGKIFPSLPPLLGPQDASRGFYPQDPFDGRKVGEWQSRYAGPLHSMIKDEAVYLAMMGLACLVLSLTAWLAAKGTWNDFLGSPTRLVACGALALAGGGLGGVTFGLKWLYHGVAKGMWSLDRRLWRLFTPWISSAVAIAAVALLKSKVVPALNAEIVDTPAGIFGVAFLTGYFSDMTVGKFNEVAEALFGRRRGQHPQDGGAPHE